MSQAGERFDGRSPLTANEELLWRALRHAHYIERFSESEVRRIRAFLTDDMLPDLTAKLISRLDRISSRGFDSGIEKTQRWSDVVSAIEDIVGNGMQDAFKSTRASLVDLAKYESKWQVDALSRSVPAELAVEFELPAPNVLRQLTSDRPIAGGKLEDWFDKLSIDTADRIKRQVRIGLAEGEGVPDIVARIRGTGELRGTDGTFEVTRRQAETIVRSSAVSVSNHAKQETYRKNSRSIKGEKWVSTLDLRTCPVCGGLDGTQFEIGEGPMPVDSTHPNCRCQRVPVLKSLEDLGLKGRKWSEGTRASMDGQVPADLTYSEWLSSLDKSELAEALGAKRAELFSSGKVSFSKMVDQFHRPLTLEQIAQREGL